MRYLLTTRAVWKISKLFPIHIKRKDRIIACDHSVFFLQIKLNYCAEAWFRQSVTASRILPLDSVQPEIVSTLTEFFPQRSPLADR